MLDKLKLAFATGSAPRPLPEPFRNRANVHELRTLADLPPIPPSFDTPASDQDAMPFEGDVP